ncbi:hypothetical protein BDW59DRAFT_139873 [Aspergillus cavernicola]|uniref:Nephrocystin 3-like N-terminal domain-containing protein n=1 Tax=Aspergillus cavernicola TaxID=176166 RepID=A0ABR4IVC9_9EURO
MVTLGTGKSTMAITMVEELPNHLSFRDCDRTLVYFFGDASSEDRRTATALLRTIISQLINQRLEPIDFVLSQVRGTNGEAAGIIRRAVVNPDKHCTG